MMTFEEWRETRQFAPDIANLTGDPEQKVQPGFVYAGGACWIAVRPDATFWTMIERSEYAGAIHEVEKPLYEWWCAEIAGVQPETDPPVDLFAPVTVDAADYDRLRAALGGLGLAIQALNEVPNSRVRMAGYRTTYELIPVLEQLYKAANAGS